MMAKYARLDGSDEERADRLRQGKVTLKRDVLVVLLAIALFATILGSFFYPKLKKFLPLGSRSSIWTASKRGSSYDSGDRCRWRFRWRWEI